MGEEGTCDGNHKLENKILESIDFSIQGEALEPYLKIAESLGLRKEKPDNPKDMIWVDKKGTRLILCRRGFMNVEQEHYRTKYEELKENHDKNIKQLFQLRNKMTAINQAKK